MKFFKRMISLVMASLMMVPAATMSVVSSTVETQASTTATIDRSDGHIMYSSIGVGSSWSTYMYSATINKVRSQAFCGNGDAKSPNDSTLPALKIDSNSTTAKVMYYGWVATGDDSFWSTHYTTKSKSWRYVAVHLAVCKAAGEDDYGGTGDGYRITSQEIKDARDALIAYAKSKGNLRSSSDVWWQQNGAHVKTTTEMSDANAYFAACTNTKVGDKDEAGNDTHWLTETQSEKFAAAVSFRNDNEDQNFHITVPSTLSAVLLTNNSGAHTVKRIYGYGTDINFDGSKSGDYIIVFRCRDSSVTNATVTLEGSKVTTDIRAYRLPCKYHQQLFTMSTTSDSDSAALNVVFNQDMDYDVSKVDNNENPIAGAQFKISKSSDMSNPLQTITTDKDGNGTFTKLKYGETYYIQEVSVPEPYVVDTEIKKVKVTGNADSNSVTFADDVQTGSIRPVKIDKSTKKEVAGAKFRVVNTTAVTDKDGNVYAAGKYSKDITATTDFPLGTYSVTEIEAPSGYILNPETQTVTVSYDAAKAKAGQNAAEVSFTVEDPHEGYVAVTKSSKDCGEYVDSEASSNAAYTLKGAIYSVYSDSGYTQKLFDLPATDANGQTVSTKDQAKQLESGTVYYIKETSASTGHKLDAAGYSMAACDTPDAAKANAAQSPEPGIGDPLKAFVAKVDKETGRSNGQGNASLAGATFTLTYYNKYYDKNSLPAQHTRQWVFKTDENGVAKFDNAHKVSGDAMPALGQFPLGTYTVTETSAPKGYKLEDSTITDTAGKSYSATDKVYFQIQQNGLDEPKIINADGKEIKSITSLHDALNKDDEQVIRGTVKIQKNNADVPQDTGATSPEGDASLEGAEYQVINNSENPVLVDTNGNGKFGWSDTNGNGVLDDNEDIASDEWYKKGEVITTLKTDKDGKASMPAKSLPYGSYIIKEVKAPRGYLLTATRGAITQQTFDITTEGQVVNFEWKNEKEEANDFTHSFYNAPTRGQLKLKKNNADVHSDDPDVKSAQGDSTLDGAVYEIVNKSDSYVWVDANQNGKYDWNDKNGNGKFDADEDTADDEKFAPGERITTITTGYREGIGHGYAETPEKFLPYGTYLVREIKAPKGYLLTANGFRGAITSKTFHIGYSGENGNPSDPGTDSFSYIGTDGKAVTDADELTSDFTYDHAKGSGNIENTFYDAAPRGTFKFKKRDLETKKNTPLGGAKLNGTYQLINRSSSYVWVNLDGSRDSAGNPTYDKSEKFAPGAIIMKFVTDAHTGYFDTYSDLNDDEKVMRADGTALDKKNLGKLLLPYGTYEIYEEVPPTGYLHLPKEKLSVKFSLRNKGTDGSELTDKDAPEIADMTDDEFHKDSSAKDQSSASTKNAVYNYVMRGDIYFDKRSFNARTNDDDADNDTSSAKKESYIPFRITSLDQDGKAVESHIVFTDANGIYDSRNSYAKHSYRTNAGDNGYNAKTKTVTDDDNSKGHVGTWFGIDQGAPVKDSISDRTDENGKTYNELGAFPYGRYKIDELPCAKNKGVNLYHGSFTVSHEASTNITEYSDPADWANGGQLHDNPDLGTIYDRYVTISTEALEREHSSHSTAVSDDVDIDDSVEMNNLLQNEKYRLTATLVYSDSGETVKDADGTDLTFVKNFTAKNEFTTVKVPVNIDAESLGLGGKTITVYEKLERVMKDGSTEAVASEEDPLDEEQQITFPGASTTALAGNGQQLEEAKKDVTITDTVAYKNFVKGKKYTIDTYLVDKETGNYITVGGEKITAETTFKAENTSGTQDVKITFDASELEGKSVVVFEKIYKGDTLYAQHADVNDEGQTIRFPAVHTTATDKETSEHIGAENGTQIVDEVAYSNVTAGKEYTIKGRLVSKSDPSKVIAEAETKFTAPGTSGTVALTFNVKLSDYNGQTLVAYEDLYLGDTVIGRHENPDDENQSVHKPSVKTTAIDKTTGDHTASRNEKATFTDTVAYSNVIVGKEYTIKGELYDKSTGKSLGITAEKTFTAEKTEGTVDLEFTVDTTKLAGTTVVAEEHMYYNGIEVGAHADLTDEEQSVHVPEIKTTATDKATGDKNTKYGTDTVITDTVSYTNLVAGKEYTIKGELYDKATGQSIGVKAEKTFTPEASEGSVDIEFTVDTTKLAGKTLVAFESMSHNGAEVAVHADISDVPQTVYVPDVHTTATAETTGDKTVAYGSTEKIKDTVTYSNLIVGKEYTVKGELYDKSTGKSIGVKAEKTFIAEKTEGTIDLEFTVDATKLAGKTLVAFENVQHNGVTVGSHADISDTAQSVYVPGIHTTATDKSTKTKTVSSSLKAKITDTVAYTNLTAGKQYTVKGELYSKATGRSIGAKAEKTFTAKASSGKITLEFTVVAVKLEGQTLVAFENLYQDKILVGVHADIGDKAQTVYVPSIGTTAKDKATGTKTASYGKKTVITDTVAYRNLVAGKRYTVKGELYDRATGKSLGVKASKTFTAKTANGKVTLDFTVDTTKLAGHSAVAFEKVYQNGVLVGTHANLKDAAQTVYVPSLHTTAKINGGKTATASSKMTVDDRVYFRNLVKGQKYTVKGTLYDQATGKALSISGRKITKSVTFTAKAASGYTDVKFTFNGSACGGHSIVVFENLYLKGRLVGQHADINDDSQTVVVIKPEAPVKKPKVKSTKTGDATHILPYVAALAAAAAVIALVVIARRKRK